MSGRRRRKSCYQPNGRTQCGAITTIRASSAWVPVNESMGFPGLSLEHAGQYAFIERMVRVTRRLDSTRPVIDNDGWEHTDITDICAIHDYTPTAEKLSTRYKETLKSGELSGEGLGR